MTRPSWDEYFLGVAKAVSTRASCPRASIGAVLTDEQYHIIGVGYNGAPHGVSECDITGCEIVNGHCVRAVHAERNAMRHASYQQRNHTVMYTSGRPPCWECARELIQFGVRRFVWSY